jgi:glycosyltransferase involved in cell wall biosynthesis
MKLQKKDGRIKIINHSKNLGTYHSRVEGVLNSKSEYILFLDPDDMIINPFLFEKVYDNYLNYNLDIIEYTVFYQNEEKKELFVLDVINNDYKKCLIFVRKTMEKEKEIQKAKQ